MRDPLRSRCNKEVIHEDAIKVSGKTKAPDYSFRIGGIRKFFVEAKKPAINLKENPEPAYQLRRYAWSAKLPVSILTDFEEFIVFDCTKKPLLHDKSSMGRIEYYTYKDYIERWDEIESKYSKNSIYTGKFDDLAESLVSKKGGKGTAGIDDAFLIEIEGWRDILAKNIALRNNELSVQELNLAVQKIIDRIIFLRICEDRGIEEYGQLKKKAEGKEIYENLKDLFIYADNKYNSGLFHFEKEDWMEEPDILTLSLKIDDKILKQILSHLYYPESPYEFSVFPADILGHVYEQFLGKVIRLTDSHQAKIEEKPEVKKAGGVFYTPTYIVDYIVKNTVGRLVEGKTPNEVSELKILDPACGSGSFLIGAYQYLLDWHIGWYIDKLVPFIKAGKPATDKEVQKLLPVKPIPKKKGKKKIRSAGLDYDFPIYQMSETDWRLTSDEKKRILLNNIYGVDIDQQAVEVTKLSLLLKVLEGEKGERIAKQLTITQERVLPSLHENIKCGNSLIGSDIYSNGQMAFDNDEEFYRINAFDWNQEFAGVFEQGGFDAVIGNPPYVRIQSMKEWNPIEVEFYKKLYKSASKGNYDVYVIFVEKGLSFLNKDGLLGYILPHKFFNTKYGESLREIISEGKNLKKIIHFGHQQVFKNASTYTCLLFLRKEEQKSFEFEMVESIDLWRQNEDCKSSIIPTSVVDKNEWNFFIGNADKLFKKLHFDSISLEHVTDRIFQGIKTGADKVYIVNEIIRDNNLIKIYSPEKKTEYWVEASLFHPLIKGGDSKPYYIQKTKRLILFPFHNYNDQVKLISELNFKEKYPLVWQYLKDNRTLLENREKGKLKGKDWYNYTRNQAIEVISKQKIFTPDLVSEVSFSYDSDGDFFFTGGAAGGYGIVTSDDYSKEYILGILNSNLVNWFLLHTSTKMQGGWFSCESRFIKHIPIHKIDFSNSEDVVRHDKVVLLVKQMLEMNKKLDNSKLGSEKEMIQRRIAATDAEINRLVYQLYDLTEEEIKIVEMKQ
nr:N-6 DNA methylase [Methanosarcina mazei]